MEAQNTSADGVKGAKPGHAFYRRADHAADALLHLARGLVGEGHRHDLARVRAAGCQDVRYASREDARLAGACTCQNQDGSIQRLDSLLLLGVEAVEPGRILRARGKRACGDAGR